MSSKESESGAGCLLVIAIACVGFGIGHLAGPAWGFLSVGVTILLLAVLSS